ncbi:MAG: peptidoglycan recognition protein [Actinomycetota bacterium]|jgi:hypothetical protein|nr:peptidoglycan recognition protein [Actinomycetota bacterium]
MEIITRDTWGAAPPKHTLEEISGPVSDVFLHHTVTDSGPEDQEAELARTVQQIAFDRGFADISYSFLVFPTGHVFEGRGFGKVGAHTLGHNSTSYALSLVGNYEIEPMTDAQVESVRGMIAEGQRQGFIAADFTLRGHKQVDATACPGAHAFARIPEMVGNGNGNGAHPSDGDAPPFPGLLEQGAHGGPVCTLQRRLRELGHAIADVAGCPFGPQTEAAVRAFQQERQLEVDGIVGPATWRALFG